MTVQIVERQRRQSDVIKFLGSDTDYVFDQGTLPAGAQADASALFDIGTVLGRVTSGAITVGAPAAGGGNTGSGAAALGDPAYADTVRAGTYLAVALGPDQFEVFDPNGDLVGIAAVGKAFETDVCLTITSGGTDFSAGDSFSILVAASAGSGDLVQIDPTGFDGRQNFAGVVAYRTTADASDDTPIVVAARGPLIVVADNLIWPSSMSAGEIATALAQAAAVGIKVQPYA